MTRTFAVTLALVFACLPAPHDAAAQGGATTTAPQADAPTAVRLNVLVTDEQGRFADDVRREDFRVEEDGRERPVTVFERDESPLDYALVVDNSGSVEKLFSALLRTAKSFISYNRPEDETAVVRFVSSDTINLLSDFTSDKAALGKAIDQMTREGGRTAILDAVYVTVEHMNKRPRPAAGAPPRRRALVLITDGEERESVRRLEDLLELLRASNVQIFCVGFVGALDKTSGFTRPSPRKNAMKLLEQLAGETGGRAFFPLKESELEDAFGEVMRHLRTQFVVGYDPPPDRRGKGPRKVEVKIADLPGRGKRLAVTRPRLPASP